MDNLLHCNCNCTPKYCECFSKPLKPSSIKPGTHPSQYMFVNDGTCNKCQIAGNLCQCGFNNQECPVGTHNHTLKILYFF